MFKPTSIAVFARPSRPAALLALVASLSLFMGLVAPVDDAFAALNNACNGSDNGKPPTTLAVTLTDVNGGQLVAGDTVHAKATWLQTLNDPGGRILVCIKVNGLFVFSDEFTPPTGGVFEFDFTVGPAGDVQALDGQQVCSTAFLTGTQAPGDTPAGQKAVGNCLTFVVPSADMRVTKTPPTQTIVSGANAVYTITATNNGPSDATSVLVSDALPAQMTHVSTAWSGPGTGGCLTTALTCTIATLANGAAVTMTVTATSTTVGGPYTNTASVSSSVTDPTPGNNSATATTSVIATASADLSVTKTPANQTIVTGSNATYVITATNNGPSPATSVVVSDALPAQMTHVSTAWAGPGTGGCLTTALTCTIATLASGDAVTMTVTATSTAIGGPYTNTASVSNAVADPTPGNNTADATTSVNAVASADVKISKDQNPASIVQGSNTTYTVTATNDGPNAATGVVVTDTLPAGMTQVSATWTGATNGNCTNGSLTCNVGAMASGASVTLTFVATGTTVGTHRNTAAVSSTGPADPNLGNNSAFVDTVVTAPVVGPLPPGPVPPPPPPPPPVQPDLAITKTGAPGSIPVGSNVIYTLSVTNKSTAAAPNAVVTDALPLGLEFIGSTPGAPTCTNSHNAVTTIDTLTCQLGIIVGGATTTVTVVAKALAPGTFTNVASVGPADATPLDNIDDEVTEVTPIADLEVTKTAQPTQVNLGQNITYTITTTNHGPNTATGVTVTDTLPPQVTFVSASVPCTGTTTITCSLGDMLAGEVRIITIVARAHAVGLAHNAVSVISTISDPDLSNNNDEVDVPIDEVLGGVITDPSKPEPDKVLGERVKRSPAKLLPFTGSDPRIHVMVGTWMLLVGLGCLMLADRHSPTHVARRRPARRTN